MTSKILPIEPTLEMVAAGRNTGMTLTNLECRRVYRAMYDAAPAQAAAVPEAVERNAARMAFLDEHYLSMLDGRRLHEWIIEKLIWSGGLRGATDAAIERTASLAAPEAGAGGGKS